MDNWIYINGEFKKQSEASVPLDNTGLLRGLGIFDFFRTKNKKPVFLSDYLDRFMNSQKYLNLDRLIERDEIIGAVEELQRRNDFENSGFKLVLLGQGPDDVRQFSPFFYILNHPVVRSPYSYQPNGAMVITHEYVRETPVLKSLNYMTSFMLQERKVDLGATEVIYHQRGLISEASRCNIFVVKDGTLATPAVNVLQGITRKHVIESSKAILPVEIRDVTLQELLQADEVFITSTIKEVMSIVKVDDHQIGDGKPGEWTLRIHENFKEYIDNYESVNS